MQNGKLQNQTLKSVVFKTAEAHQKILKKMERINVEDGRNIKVGIIPNGRYFFVGYTMSNKEYQDRYRKIDETFSQMKTGNQIRVRKIEE